MAEYVMTNEELSDAILRTHMLIDRQLRRQDVTSMLVDQLRELLRLQLERATVMRVEADYGGPTRHI